MGQYFEVINIDKKQVICPHNFDNGLKLMEWAYDKNPVVLALVNLLAGEWKGDRVYVVGDYADTRNSSEIWFPTYNALVDELGDVSDRSEVRYFLWENFEHVMPDAGLRSWQIFPVSTAKQKASVGDFGYRFFYNHAEKKVVDMEKCPVEWTYTDEKTGENVPVRISPLALLLAMGNGRGGGDYLGKNKDLLGSWCATVQSIEVSQRPIPGTEDYENFAPMFHED